MNESQIYREFYEKEHQAELKEKIEFIEREENFEREQLTRKLSSIDKLSDSISNLSKSLAQQNSNSTVNIYIDKDMSPEKLEMVLKKINNNFNN